MKGKGTPAHTCIGDSDKLKNPQLSFIRVYHYLYKLLIKDIRRDQHTAAGSIGDRPIYRNKWMPGLWYSVCGHNPRLKQVDNPGIPQKIIMYGTSH